MKGRLYMVSGITLMVLGLGLFFWGTLRVAGAEHSSSYPPWTILRHGDTWTYAESEGSFSNFHYSAREKVEEEIVRAKKFEYDYTHGLREKLEAKRKIESAKGYWTEE